MNMYYSHWLGGLGSLLMAIGARLATIPAVWHFGFCSDLFRALVLSPFI